MTTYTCDVCGAPAKRCESQHWEVPTFPLRCDPQARIEIRISWGFIKHSTNFGGPPDLCEDCRKLALTELLQEMTK